MRLIVKLSFLSLLIGAFFLVGYVSCSQQLKNGGFEQGIDYWLRSGVEAGISDAYAHSGRYSLRTNGGSAWQTVDVEPPSNPALHFWVYLRSVPGSATGKTDAAITVTVTASSFEENLSYYVSGPNKQDADTKIVLAGELQRDQWAYVERNLREDFTKSYPTMKFDEIQKVKIKIWSLPTHDPLPFWDDISLEYLEVPATTTASPTPTTQSPTPTPSATTPTETPTPPPSPPSTSPATVPTPKPTSALVEQKTEGLGNYEILALVAVGAGASAGGALYLRRRKPKTYELPVIVPKPEKPTVQGPRKGYCISCGEQLDPNADSCLKCGSSQEPAKTPDTTTTAQAPEIPQVKAELPELVAPEPTKPQPSKVEIDYDKLAEKVVEKMPKPVLREPAAIAEPKKPVTPETRGAFCTRCGAPLRADARYCTRCGSTSRRLVEPAGTDQSIEVQLRVQPPEFKRGIVVEGISVVRSNRTIIDGISFSIDQGKILGVLGPSGCGKSTIIKVLTAEYKPETGRVMLDQYDVQSQLNEVKTLLGYVPQEYQLYEDLSMTDNIIYFGGQYGLSREYLQKRTYELARAVELEDRILEPIKNFSGGQKRRVSIAVALSHNPKIVILDEPTSGLDPGTRRSLWRFLKILNQKYQVTMVVTTHFTDEGEYCDKILILNRGRAVAFDSPEKLKKMVPGRGKAIEFELFALDESSQSKLQVFKERVIESKLAKMVDLSGYRTRVFTDTPNENLQGITQLLGTIALPVKSINIVDATLEDVFVYVTGEKFISGEE